jgi:flagellar assembly factor FliW
MALDDILFSAGTAEGQDFLLEVETTSSGSLSDILTVSRTYDDSLSNELQAPIVIIDNRRRVR